LAWLADGFRVDLIERGYSLWGAQEQLYLLAHVSRWMEVEGLQLAELTPAMVERYLVWRRSRGYLSSLSPKSLRRLFGHLDGLGVLPHEDAVPSPVERLVGEFRGYLLRERGMAAGSVLSLQPDRAAVLEGPLGAA
jgi:integrase/recombinase XerD